MAEKKKKTTKSKSALPKDFERYYQQFQSETAPTMSAEELQETYKQLAKSLGAGKTKTVKSPTQKSIDKKAKQLYKQMGGTGVGAYEEFTPAQLAELSQSIYGALGGTGVPEYQQMTPQDLIDMGQMLYGAMGGTGIGEYKTPSRDEYTRLYNEILAAQGTPTEMPEFGTRPEFEALLDDIRSKMGDDATLKANIEAALRPSYDKSLAELQKQAAANNAKIDVDAASRGMGNSTWVTDAKLQNLRNAESARADLEGNYNATLYGNLIDAINKRDDDAWNQATHWWDNEQNQKLNQMNMIRQDRQNAAAQALDWTNMQASYDANERAAQRGIVQSGFGMAADQLSQMYGRDDTERARQLGLLGDAYGQAWAQTQYGLGRSDTERDRQIGLMQYGQDAARQQALDQYGFGVDAWGRQRTLDDTAWGRAMDLQSQQQWAQQFGAGRDDEAWQRAMQWWQYDQQKKGTGAPTTPGDDGRLTYEEWLALYGTPQTPQTPTPITPVVPKPKESLRTPRPVESKQTLK